MASLPKVRSTTKDVAEMRNVPSNSADAYDTTFCLSMDPSLTCDVLIYA